MSTDVIAEYSPRLMARDSAAEAGKYGVVNINNRWIAKLACPICGKVAYLFDHEIDEAGRVSPSVECPHNCGFHRFVILDGWHFGISKPPAT